MSKEEYLIEFGGGLPSILFHLWTRTRQVYYPHLFYARHSKSIINKCKKIENKSCDNYTLW